MSHRGSDRRNGGPAEEPAGAAPGGGGRAEADETRGHEPRGHESGGHGSGGHGSGGHGHAGGERHPLRDARADLAEAHGVPDTPQTRSPVYRLAFDDPDFLLRDEMRGLRLQLEMTKPDRVMDEEGVRSTVVLFGGARIPAPERAHEARTETLAGLARFYEEARRFARLVTERAEPGEDVIVTGGGPGVMEAGNRGAREAGGRSVGLGIVLPHEQAPNLYVTPELCFNFHYFATRKMHFLIRARAVAVFPGGFGTMDELFETLTLIQTGRMERVPVLLFGRGFWERVVSFEALAEAGTISREDLSLFHYVETAEEAVEAMRAWPPAPPRQEIPGRPAPAGAPGGGKPDGPARRSPPERPAIEKG